MSSHGVTHTVTDAVTHGGSHTSPSRPVPRPVPENNLPVTEVVVHYAARARELDRMAQRIATESVKRLDELALIGYPILTLEQRSVYEVVIRQVAEGVVG